MPFFPQPVGGAAPQAPQTLPFPPIREVAGRSMRLLSGGVFPQGGEVTHRQFGNTPPRMARIVVPGGQLLGVAIMPETEDQYRTVRGRPGREDAPGNHPVTCVSWRGFMDYLRQVNAESKEQLGLLTEAEWEYAARGEPEDVRRFMEEEGIKNANQLIEHLKANHYYLENFINVDPVKNPAEALALGVNICTDIHSERFKKLIDGTGQVFGWYAFATLSGRLAPEEAVYNQRGTIPVSPDKRLNRFGISDMTGHVYECTGDVYDSQAYTKLPAENPVTPPKNEEDDSPRVVRGGFWYSNEDRLRVANRNNHPDNDNNNLGARVASLVPQHSL